MGFRERIRSTGRQGDRLKFDPSATTPLYPPPHDVFAQQHSFQTVLSFAQRVDKGAAWHRNDHRIPPLQLESGPRHQIVARADRPQRLWPGMNLAKSPITFCIDSNALPPDETTPCSALITFWVCRMSGIIAIAALASLTPGTPAI